MKGEGQGVPKEMIIGHGDQLVFGGRGEERG